MTVFRTTLLLLMVALQFSVVIQAQGVHTLQGKVITPGGIQPRNPVRVTLTYNGRRIYETFTDLSGRFSFSGIAKGTYQLTAEGDGQSFETTSVYAEVSAFGSAPQLFSQDIQLRPVPGKPLPKAAVINAFTQDVPKPARQAFERAMKLLEGGKAEPAIEQMREALKIFPEYFEAHLELGNQFLKAANLSEAIAELDLARQINPNDERSYESFGLVLMQQKNYAVAVAVFAEASRLNPGNPMSLLMRATALIHQAASLDPSSSGKALDDRNYLITKAETALSQASKLSGRKLKADSLTLALFYEMKGEKDRAAEELESYLRKSPNADNAEAIKSEIKRLREAAKEAKSPL